MRLFLVVLFAIIAVSQALFVNFGQLNGYRPIIQGQNAVIPLCFPRGFPYVSAPPGRCYAVGFPGSIHPNAGPCLPPVVNGVLVPPCVGKFFVLESYY